MNRFPVFPMLLLFGVSVRPIAFADEGIWLYNGFPKGRVAEKHKLKVADQFLERLRLGSVRLNNGGSGSFVSPGGLIFTNHHVASECIQKLSSKEHDYMNKGFYAATLSEEKACPDVEVNLLLQIEDVTAEVNKEVRSDTVPAEANRIRKAASTAIEKSCTQQTGNRCDVVNLYSGGMYHLYQYKKYSDIRLVFAPEVSIAAFGGDPDNFTYPRYCLDFAFLRAYENGKPAGTPDYLRWSKTGVKDRELTFVSGHPGTTGRLATLAALEFFRDVSYPRVLDFLSANIETLKEYSAESQENKRIAQDLLFSFQNGFKAYTGFLAGLREPELMNRKRDEERTLRDKVLAAAEGQAKFGGIWEEVAAAYQEYRQFYAEHMLLESNAARGSELFNLARKVLRYSEETKKPNDKRMREYVDPALPSLEQELYSPAPIHSSMEIAVLANYLRYIEKVLGPGHEAVKAALGGLSPEKAAEQYVKTSRLAGVDERKRLATDADAARTSTDGMMQLARRLDGPARTVRQRHEDKVEAVLNSSAARIAQARFAAYGAEDYPDATFTLRLSYGPVRGYRNAKGEAVPWATDFAGLYRRATGVEPFQLPGRWLERKGALNLRTPFNFVTTNDTHGGNSGSPTVNAAGEVVGILFDGNMEGLPNRFVYRDERERSVHVASQAVVEALRKVYGAQRLVRELGL